MRRPCARQARLLPDDVKLAKQLTAAVPYDAAKAAALGVPALQLQLYWWNTAKQE